MVIVEELANAIRSAAAYNSDVQALSCRKHLVSGGRWTGGYEDV